MIDELATRVEFNDLRQEMHEMRAELIRTIYIVAIVQYLAIVASVILTLKTMV